MPIVPNNDVRLVIDTNTAVSGLLWNSGPPARLIDAAETGRITLASSTALLPELQDRRDCRRGPAEHSVQPYRSQLLLPAHSNPLNYRCCISVATRTAKDRRHGHHDESQNAMCFYWSRYCPFRRSPGRREPWRLRLPGAFDCGRMHSGTPTNVR